MIELIIDQRFKSKIPHLTDEEFEMLEKNILADGEIREPLVVWKGKGIIVDGHNRHRIWQSHPELPEPRIKEIDFADEWAAISWMCGNQLGRRTVSNAVKAELIAQKYEAEKHTHGGNRKTGEFSKPNNWGLEIETDEEHEHKSKRERTTAFNVGKELGVSKNTVDNSVSFSRGLHKADDAVPGFKDEVLSGKIKPSMKDVAEIRKMDSEQAKQAVEEIKQKAAKPKPKRPNGELPSSREINKVCANLVDQNRKTTIGIDELRKRIEDLADYFMTELRRELTLNPEVVKNGRMEIAKTIKESIENFENIYKEF